MKFVRSACIVRYSVGFCIVAGVVSPSSADNGFTVQGNLYRDNRMVHNETADFQFSLWTADSGGTQVGTTQLVAGVPVQYALFSAKVDFGDVFNGTTLYLQTSVKSGADVAFTAMAQRAAINQAPQTQSTAAMRNAQLDPAATVSLVGTPGNGAFSVRRNLGGPNYNEVTMNAVGTGGNAVVAAKSNSGPSALDFAYGAQTAMRVTDDPDNPGTAAMLVGPAGIVFADAALLDAEGDVEARAATTHFRAGTNPGGPRPTAASALPTFEIQSVAAGFPTTHMQIDSGTGAATFRNDIRAGGRVLVGDNALAFENTAGGPPPVFATLEFVPPVVNVTAGTSSQAELQLKVNDDVVARWTAPGDTGFGVAPNYLTGSASNSVADGVNGAIVVGGSSTGPNSVTGNLGTVAGGLNNQADLFSAVGGGESNTASGRGAAIPGGESNTATGRNSAVTGGDFNLASGRSSAVLGGSANTASGRWSATLAGQSNQAGGAHSAAAGQRAVVRDAVATGEIVGGDFAGDEGTFIWGDSADDNPSARINDTYSTGPNQFIVRARGGLWFGEKLLTTPDAFYPGGRDNAVIPSGRFVQTTAGAQSCAATCNSTYDYATQLALRIACIDGCNSNGAYLSTGGTWTNASDRNSKEHVEPVQPREVLNRVLNLGISQWNYKVEADTTRHIGPMAQDFHSAFGLGDSDKTISTIDADGVALAAIQGLYQVVQDKVCRVEELQDQNGELMRRNAELEARVAAIEALLMKSSNDASR